MPDLLADDQNRRRKLAGSFRRDPRDLGVDRREDRADDGQRASAEIYVSL